MTTNAAEIAKIEHELDILRSRYAIFAYWATVVKWVFMAAAVIVVALILILGVFRDPLLAGFMAFVIAAIVGTIYLGMRGKLRWIDVVSPAPWPRGFGWGGASIFERGPRSEAVVVEDMIADREARLAELRGSRR